MPGEKEPGSRLQSFLLGSLMGGVAGFAASHLRSRRAAAGGVGGQGELRPFEAAPCFQEALEAKGEQQPDRPR